MPRGVKRWFLHIGMLLLLAACFLWGDVLKDYLSVTKVTAEVTKPYEAGTCYADHKDGEFVYICGGKIFTQPLLYEKEVGSKFDVYVSNDNLSEYTLIPADMTAQAAIVTIIGGMLLLIFCGGFRNYKTEFLSRYKKYCIISLSTIMVGILGTVYYLYVYQPHYGGLMPGLDSLRDFLFWIAGMSLLFLLNLVLWITATISVNRKERKAD